MSQPKQSRTKLTTLQLEILTDLVQSLKPNTKDGRISYKAITQLFNEKCREKVDNFRKKSVKTVQLQIRQICGIEKHYWDCRLDQMMLDAIAVGFKWKKISTLPEFKLHELTPKQIQQKFECSARAKFGYLYRQVYKDEAPKINDVTLKCLLQKNRILEHYNNNDLNAEERECLLVNTRLFCTSIDNKNMQEKREVRSFKTKFRVLELLGDSSIRLLVNSILKLHYLKKCMDPTSIPDLLLSHYPQNPHLREQGGQQCPDSTCNSGGCWGPSKQQRPQGKNSEGDQEVVRQELDGILPLEGQDAESDYIFRRGPHLYYSSDL